MDGSAASVRTLQCPNCGGALIVRGLRQTQSVVCGSCHSIVDLTGDTLRILSTFSAKVKYEPLIPLGTRGTLHGDTYEVIGYARRAITVEDVDYEWSEYLLFNPYKGFRWLTEYNGHWNDTKTTTSVPEETPGVSAQYLSRRFKHFQTAEARVTYVLGEFYWRVSVGETARVTDYVSPPLVLSKEETKDETTWSLGEYIEPQDLWRAFKLTTPPPPRVGVYENQPAPGGPVASRVWRMWLRLAGAAVLLQIVFYAIAQDKLVFDKTFDYTAERKGTAEVTPVFDLGGRTSNVVIRTETNVDNTWIYLNLALISMDDGHAYDFGREIGYYHGVEGGESWTEGSTKDEAVLPAVPPGQYYLRVEPESEAAAVHYVIRVYRDVPRFLFLWIALGLLTVYPILVGLRRASFESKRWAESDHAG